MELLEDVLSSRVRCQCRVFSSVSKSVGGYFEKVDLQRITAECLADLAEHISQKIVVRSAPALVFDSSKTA